MNNMSDLTELRLMKKVAHLYYEMDATQQEIAAKLNLSRPKVSRLLKQARETGIVRISIADAIESCSDLSSTLRAYFNLKEAVVVPTSAYIPDMFRQVVGKAAATYLNQTLQSRMSIGISWGITLYETVKAMAPLKLSQVHVVQLMGGLGQTSPVLQSLELAKQLAELTGGTCHMLHAPAITGSAEARDAITLERSISQVLDLARTIDLAVVGFDALWRHTSLVQVEGLGPQELSALDRAKAVGECCFHFYGITGETALPELDRRTIAIELDELKDVPNVVGVATGLDTTEAILGGLNLGVLDVLITDEISAEKIIMLEDDRRENIVRERAAE